MTDWVPIVLTALVSGGLGSVVTTYGTQTRERRQARADARDAIRQVQNAIFPVPTHERLVAVLDNLETSAMLAGLPKKLTSLNRQAMLIRRDLLASAAEGGSAGAGDLSFAVQHISGETLQLLTDATWHPLLGAPLRWWRTRRLDQVMDTFPRPGPRPRDKRRWERETIAKAEQELLKQRREGSARH